MIFLLEEMTFRWRRGGRLEKHVVHNQQQQRREVFWGEKEHTYTQFGDKAREIVGGGGGMKLKQFLPTFRNHYLISNENDTRTTNKCRDTR